LHLRDDAVREQAVRVQQLLGALDLVDDQAIMRGFGVILAGFVAIIVLLVW